MTLARFRADPARVRVGVRHNGSRWTATVSEKGDGATVDSARSTSTDPRNAVRKALNAAQLRGLEGIDLGMQWAYDHPQRPDSDSPKA